LDEEERPEEDDVILVEEVAGTVFEPLPFQSGAGLSEEEIGKFVASAGTLAPGFIENSEVGSCALCLETFEVDTFVVIPVCLHKVCWDCFEKLSRTYRDCPTCRRDLIHGTIRQTR